ncbi:sodium:solute symporter family transporter [Candidatus Caldatribacterium sp.]|uniref:sodium:solute symporter family transporter n=1 Tax=Candidatus Caldatribacterium sp. TaxID=2282143 RepID=UPI0029940B5D|nr:sodium/solute symporter [Candidatus Caldatribacterium sp.]MDW8081656.1 sodium/solute symporter [Candidatus Calescibacterium sp.]
MKALVLVVYVVGMLALGCLASRRTKNLGDFFLAGRNLGPWISAFAYGTTYFSAVLFIGYAGRIGWGFGLSSLSIVLGNTLVGSLLAWVVLARRTRKLTEALGAMTMPEFLEARYGSPALRVLAAFIIFVFLVPYSASVYMGLSYLFDAVLGIPYRYALAFMALLTGVYLLMGGYLAVNFTDAVQGMIMLFGSFFLVGYLLARPEVGGIGGAITKLAHLDPRLVSAVGPPGFWPLFGLVVLTSLGPWGLPQMVQKFYAIRNEKVVKTATVVATIFAFVCTFGAYFSGSLTRLFFTAPPLSPEGKPDLDLLMPHLVASVMPSSFALVFLLLVFSASMSTLSSLVLVSSSAVVIDLVPPTSRLRSLLFMRVLCGLFVALSLLLALYRVSFIVNLMSISWGTVAGSFIAPYLWGLYWKRGNRWGAFVSLLTGLGVSLFGSFALGFRSAALPLVGSLAMIVPLGVYPLVSILTGGEEHASVRF